MHPRALFPTALMALLLAAGASQAAVRIDCKPAKSGACIMPPEPPAAPAPPAPPPAPAAIPALPAPPAPPALPEIPAGAHAACKGKADGSRLSWSLGPGETMGGLCERVDGRMVFRLRQYEKKD